MKTTQKHFKLFKKECKKWIKTFGLLNWEVDFIHRLSDEGIASTKYLYDNKWCEISLNKNWVNTKPTNYEIKRSSFHEAMELFLVSIRTIAESRYIKEDDIDPEIHNIIRTLENVIFDSI